MKISKGTLLPFIFLLFISCLADNYETISVEIFETALKNKNVKLISFGPKEGEIKIEFNNKENLYLIKNDSIKSKDFNDYINNIVHKYDTENIVFQTQSNFYNF